MFSEKKVIEVSRDFVCVRLESYESEEHQGMVRDLLRGAFANTAFCVLAPDGKKRLSSSGRSPAALFGRRGGPEFGAEEVVEVLQEISSEYKAKGDDEDAVIQDFHSFRQALNVAAGDQRLLVYTISKESERKKAEKVLQAVLNDAEIEGLFHHDFGDAAIDKDWMKSVSDERTGSGFVVIHADEFGMQGEVVARLSLETSSKALREKLVASNEAFAESEERKIYGEHVREGRRNGVFFEGGMPYGEDRDGDGKIDVKRGRR